MIIGIQGDKGSNNERACKEFCKKNNIKDYKIKYLISTKNVLKELNEEKIDLGTFAVKSASGFVEETQEAIKEYNFEKIDELSLNINHSLLGVEKLYNKDYTKILSHPQALKEHGYYLVLKYPNAKLIETEDTALAAKNLKDNKYDNNTLIIAPFICCRLYNLEIIEKDLPSKKKYITNFYLVKKTSKNCADK